MLQCACTCIFLLRGERKFSGGGQSEIKCVIEEDEAKPRFPKKWGEGLYTCTCKKLTLGEIHLDVLEISMELTQQAKTWNHTYCSLQFV